MHVGFTGTRHGMTKAQFAKVAELLATFCAEEQSFFHHGLCVGSDCEAAELALSLGYTVIAHPGYFPKNPSWKGTRGNMNGNHIIHPEKPFLERDHDIVNESEILIATPNQKDEQLRSGTWATIRYGQKEKLVVIIFPDGTSTLRGK